MTKSKIKYQKRKYRINDAVYVISNEYCSSFGVDILSFKWDYHFCKKKKIKNKRNEGTKFKIQFFSKFLALKFCSTSPPGGNQVDGLPPVVKYWSACTSDSVYLSGRLFETFALDDWFLSSILTSISKSATFKMSVVYVSLFSLSMSSWCWNFASLNLGPV